jgi:hypothetical protein
MPTRRIDGQISSGSLKNPCGSARYSGALVTGRVDSRPQATCLVSKKSFALLKGGETPILGLTDYWRRRDCQSDFVLALIDDRGHAANRGPTANWNLTL